MWKCKQPQILKSILNKVEGLILLDFKTYCKTTIIKDIQMNETEQSTETDLHLYMAN